METDFSLIGRVRRGQLNFEQLVEVLSTRGYVTDGDGPQGLGFLRSAIDMVHQDDFDALFNLLLPGQFNNIKLMKHGTDKGGPYGCFTTAMFNTEILDRAEMDQVLIEMNRQQNRKF